MHENVILLSMSTLNYRTISHYHHKINDELEYRFHGISQLEPGTKYILTKLMDKGEKVDRIIIMESEETLKAQKSENGTQESAVDFYKRRILEFCQGKEAPFKVQCENESDREWQIELERKIQEELFGENQVYTYKELVKVCTQFSENYEKSYKERLKEPLTDVEDIVDYNNSIEDSISQIEKLNQEEIIEWHRKLAEQYQEKRLDRLIKLRKIPFFRFIVKDNWIRQAHYWLKYRYEMLWQENEKNLAKLEKLDGIQEQNDALKRNIGIYKKNIELLESHIEYLESKKPQKIKQYIKEYVYQYYIEHEEHQKRKEKKLINPYIALEETTFVDVPVTVGGENVSFWNVIEAVKGKKNCDVHLYIDMQGGERSFMAEANAIVELLRDQNVILKGRYATRFSPANLSNSIEEVSNNYKTYELMTALRNFKECGRGDMLVRYFEKYYKDDSEAKELLKFIKSASDAILLCDTNLFEETIINLKEIFQNKDLSKETDSQIDVIWKDLEKDYHDLIISLDANNEENKSRYMEQIRWCYNRKHYQQALTILEAKMPWQYHEDGFVQNTEPKRIVEMFALKQDKVSKQDKVLRDYSFKMSDLDYYEFSFLAKNNPQNSLELAIGQNLAVRDSFQHYLELKEMRNQTNHAAGDVNKLIGLLEQFLREYDALKSDTTIERKPYHNRGEWLLGVITKESKTNTKYICISPFEYNHKIEGIRNIYKNPTLMKLDGFKKDYFAKVKASVDSGCKYNVTGEILSKGKYKQFGEQLIHVLRKKPQDFDEAIQIIEENPAILPFISSGTTTVKINVKNRNQFLKMFDRTEQNSFYKKVFETKTGNADEILTKFIKKHKIWNEDYQNNSNMVEQIIALIKALK